MEALKPGNINVGPGLTYFGEEGGEPVYLGRTTGETEFSYEVETFEIATEEDGRFDEIVEDDTISVTVPIFYTDVESLSQLIPWADVVEGTEGEKRLVVTKAVGTRLSDHSDKLIIRPKINAEKDTVDKSGDLVVHNCYPVPGPLNFAYSRSGQRVANVQFVALPAEVSETINGVEKYPFWSYGDESITGKKAPFRGLFLQKFRRFLFWQKV
ncbi:hypothetical protein [Halarsenatibacter silvermanii]|uniref:Uncharacterized protein n=1 Tax=Halarsenatibacter silvermanii TaxID=321763 RepID=A0A1G9RCA9_9FIRM|nr:hypothetical protein [Halarsenatibacter silvermanii]SDM20952.1 hypothetical protein SAMN04488692_12138 [Halarsenatibacter silvermanii]